MNIQELINEIAEEYADSITSDKSAVLQVADHFAAITRAKKIITHFLTEAEKAGFKLLKVEGSDEEIASNLYSAQNRAFENGHFDEYPILKAGFMDGIAIGREQGRRKDKWIRVEDRLPEEEDADENGEVLWRSGHNHRVDLWNINTEICGDTHWMPLPTKPNQP